MVSDQIEVHDPEMLRRLAHALSQLPRLIDHMLIEAEEETDPRLQRINRAKENARYELEQAQRELENANEDERRSAWESVSEARERLDRIEAAARTVQFALRRYQLTSNELREMPKGVLAGASKYLTDRIDAIRDYLDCSPPSSSPRIDNNSVPAPNVRSHDQSVLVRDILKGKLGRIKKAPLPRGSPNWNDLERETLGDVERKAAENVTGYKTVLKLLGDGRFDKKV